MPYRTIMKEVLRARIDIMVTLYSSFSILASIRYDNRMKPTLGNPER